MNGARSSRTERPSCAELELERFVRGDELRELILKLGGLQFPQWTQEAEGHVVPLRDDRSCPAFIQQTRRFGVQLLGQLPGREQTDEDALIASARHSLRGDQLEQRCVPALELLKRSALDLIRAEALDTAGS